MCGSGSALIWAISVAWEETFALAQAQKAGYPESVGRGRQWPSLFVSELLYLFIYFLFLFSYNCLHFLPIPPIHPSQSYAPQSFFNALSVLDPWSFSASLAYLSCTCPMIAIQVLFYSLFIHSGNFYGAFTLFQAWFRISCFGNNAKTKTDTVSVLRWLAVSLVCTPVAASISASWFGFPR